MTPSLEAGEEEPLPVRGAIGIHQRRLVSIAPFGAGHLPQLHLQPQIPSKDVRAGAEQRHLDHPTRPCLSLLEHGGQNAGKGGESRDVVTDSPAGVERGPITARHLARETRAGPERSDVIGRTVAVLPAQAVAADTAVDDVGMAAQRFVGMEPELVQRVRPEVADKDVRRGQQIFQALAIAGLPQVEHDAPLPPVVEGEPRVRQVIADPDGAEHVAHRIARRSFDLDDLCAPVGQKGGGRGCGNPHSEFDHPQVCERRQSE